MNILLINRIIYSRNGFKNMVNLIVFDLFGTLIQYEIRRNPYRQLIRHGQEQGRPVKQDDARKIMTLNCDLNEIANYFEISAPPELLQKLQLDIDEEIASLTLFEDVHEVLSMLKHLKFQIAICSNLARPYGRAVDELLSQHKFTKFLSYEVGYIKPDAEIYRKISDVTGVQAKDSLFIGDNFHCDVEGPIKFGFQAKHLIREKGCGIGEIASLGEILKIINKN